MVEGVQDKEKAIWTIPLETSKPRKSAWIVSSCLQIGIRMFSLCLPSVLHWLVFSPSSPPGYKHLNIYSCGHPKEQRWGQSLLLRSAQQPELRQEEGQYVHTALQWAETNRGRVHEDGVSRVSALGLGGGEGRETLKRHRGTKTKSSEAGMRLLMRSSLWGQILDFWKEKIPCSCSCSGGWR